MKIKRIVSILLVAVFALAMLSSCNVVNDNPMVLKVGDQKYYLQDYTDIFSAEIYNYVYNGGENEEYKTLSSAERLKKFQDYCYDKLIDMAVEDYLIAENKLADKLTDEDTAAINALVEETLADNAASLESSITEDSTTLAKMQEKYELTDEEKESIPEKANEAVEAAISAKINELNEAASSDEAVAGSDDTTGSDADKREATREDAIAAILEENELDSLEAYTKKQEEEAEFDLYFAKYKKDAAVEKYKEQVEKDNDKTYDEYKKDIFEEKKVDYLRDTKLPEFLGTEFKLEDGAAKEYYDEKVKEYKDEYAEDTSGFYNLRVAADTTEYDDDEETSSIVYVTPEGFYYVKHILLKNEETSASDAAATSGDVKASDDTDASDDATSPEDTTPSDDATSSDDITGSGTAEPLTANVSRERIDEVETELDRVRNLEKTEDKLAEFDKLVEKYNEDEGAGTEPYKTTGYLMGNGNSMVEQFAEAADKLYDGGNGEIGSISEAVISEFGIHYIQLVSILKPGEIEFEEAKATIEEQLTAEGQDKLISDKLAEAKKDVKIDDHLKSNIRSAGYGYQDMYFGSNS